MGSVTSLFARKVVDAVDAPVDRAALLRAAGIDPLAPPDVRFMISDTVYYDLLERIAAQIGPATTAFPLRVGASMRCDDYGVFGLAWKAALTLRGSLARAERYASVLSTVAGYEVRDQPGGALYLLHRDGPRRLGLRLSNEATLSSVVSIIREVAPAPFHPLAVYLKHPAPQDGAAHRDWFGCPVHFGADMDGLLIPGKTLEQSNRLGDDGISRFLETHLQQEVALRARETSFEQVLLRRVSDRLSEGPPRAGDLARQMGLSERTLHRRLAEEGLSFQVVLQKARLRLAEGLLVKSDHSIAEIAFLTGFSEQSAFSRAFKRWVDQTPAAYRAAHRP
jgi:AraC-like DNA-binding protein